MDVECNFRYNKAGLEISDEITRNYLAINGIDYYVSCLNPQIKANKGGNSYVFALFVAQEFDDESIPDKVIKISKNAEKIVKGGRIIQKDKNRRFRQEVQALYNCKKRRVGNVVDISFDGNLKCKTEGSNSYNVSFPFYIMEYAEFDLKSYLEEKNEEVDEASRVELCLQIAQGLKELNDLGYYHRDIKPDNIFVVNGIWKIGDLGLIQMRNQESLDREGELLGPRGWLSPEAMNKYLSEKVDSKNFDCNIDHQSDLFQLGKVFWYIMQGNAPIGCVKESDFIVHNSSLYAVIRQMLNHSKKRRQESIDKVIEDLKKIVDKYYC